MISLTAVVFTFIIFSCSCATNPGIQLNIYSQEEVRGCYVYNQTLGVCFDVKNGSIKLTRKSTGTVLAIFQDLGQNITLYQVLDKPFIRSGLLMVYLPDYVPREPDHMRVFAQGITSQSENGPDPLFWSHYKEALRALRKIPELLLIDRAATALRDNSTLLEILSPFYGLLYNLLMTSGVEIPPELQAPDMADETADQYGAKETRCSRPTKHDCRGMCGAGCNCWEWVCGDCCFHQSCYEHDLCCKHAPWSSYCLLPFGILDGLQISCERFSDFEACLKTTSSFSSWFQGWK